MFFLKLEGDDFERLLKLVADKKGTPVERLARLAFLKGLRLLAKADTETDTSDLLGEKQSYTRRKPIEETKAYIREHWQQETDEQMGTALGYGWGRIRDFRCEMGLLRPKGRRAKPTSTSTTEGERSASRTDKRNQKFAQLDALIREHWETKDDGDIGRMLEPSVSRIKVRARRFELGLKKVQGAKRDKAVGRSIREVVDGEEFERMVLREGYTMTEYLKIKNLTCTRERLRQVAEDLGLKHSSEDRAPEWALIHRARKLGNLNLANRKWLAEKVAAATSMLALAAELKLAERDLFLFIRAFKFTHLSFRKHGVETVKLLCAKCGTPFTRLKRWVDQRRRNANGHEHELEFYCSVSCAGKYDRTASRKRREAEMSPETQRLKRLKQEKLEREAAFIRGNWQIMSDTQLAEGLGCSTNVASNKRIALGFRRV